MLLYFYVDIVEMWRCEGGILWVYGKGVVKERGDGDEMGLVMKGVLSMGFAWGWEGGGWAVVDGMAGIGLRITFIAIQGFAMEGWERRP